MDMTVRFMKPEQGNSTQVLKITRHEKRNAPTVRGASWQLEETPSCSFSLAGSRFHPSQRPNPDEGFIPKRIFMPSRQWFIPI
jgi:hypothetical protein